MRTICRKTENYNQNKLHIAEKLRDIKEQRSDFAPLFVLKEFSSFMLILQLLQQLFPVNLSCKELFLLSEAIQVLFLPSGTQ